MREMRSWSEIMSSATESSVSLRDASIASSFSACGTVRGNPSSTKLFFISFASKELFFSYRKKKKTVKGRFFFFFFFGLPVLASLVVLELVADHAHHDVVRDESAGIHDLLGFDAQRRLLRDLFAEHVARREVAHAKLVAYPRRLRALACNTQPNPGQRRSVSKRRPKGTKQNERVARRARLQKARTCAWGPDEDGTELLGWRLSTSRDL